MKKRVHEIAKERGLPAKDVLARLKAGGLDVKAASSAVDEAAALAVLGNGGAAPATTGKAPRASKAPSTPKDGSAANQAPAAAKAPAADAPAAAEATQVEPELGALRGLREWQELRGRAGG